jgi:LmbE family N-acetylglucosaminyl deacetylase
MASVLAVHAHPDDIETLAAGTLALVAQLGHRIVIVTATAGEGGSVETGAEETAAIRTREAAAAAAVIGADYRCAGLGDLSVFNDDASRRRLTEVVRQARPDIVLTASPADYHPDHEAVSQLVRDACFAASVPNYRTGPAAALAAIPHLYFMDPIGGRDRQGARIRPDFGVDIGPVMDAKRRMLTAHASQFAWVARQHGIIDYIASMEAWAERRGRDFGVVRRGLAPLRRLPERCGAGGAAWRGRAAARGLEGLSCARPLGAARSSERLTFPGRGANSPPMPAAQPQPSRAATNALVVMAVVVSGAALHWMSPILTPLALALF